MSLNKELGQEVEEVTLLYYLPTFPRDLPSFLYTYVFLYGVLFSTLSMKLFLRHLRGEGGRELLSDCDKLFSISFRKRNKTLYWKPPKDT